MEMRFINCGITLYNNIIEDELFSSSFIKDIHVLDFDYIQLSYPRTSNKKLAQMFKPVLSTSHKMRSSGPAEQ
jgi:hypothetical protein